MRWKLGKNGKKWPFFGGEFCSLKSEYPDFGPKQGGTHLQSLVVKWIRKYIHFSLLPIIENFLKSQNPVSFVCFPSPPHGGQVSLPFARPPSGDAIDSSSFRYRVLPKNGVANLQKVPPGV